MKNRQETLKIAEHLVQFPKEKFALATVLEIEGSSYRRPGAKLLIGESGRVVGQVSGGCLEETVQLEAQKVIASGKPSLLILDTTDEEGTLWGFGMGCRGVLHILVEAVDPVSWPSELAQALQGDHGVEWTREIHAEAGNVQFKITDTDDVSNFSWDQRGEIHHITEAFPRPQRLIICGAGDDAVPLAELASTCGLQVVMVDHRPAYCTAERFPSAHQCLVAQHVEELAIDLHGAAVVVQTHRYDKDEEWLRGVLQSRIVYAGVLGPVDRCQQIIKEIENPQNIPIHGPIGLHIGAEGSEQIAVSILAEILAVLNGVTPGHMNTLTGKIHPEA